MKYIVLYILISAFLLKSCVYDNEEDKYFGKITTSNPLDSGLIAFFCFENSLADSSRNNISAKLYGKTSYSDSLGRKALRFISPDACIEIPAGNHDTIAVLFLFVGDGLLSSSQTSYLLSYGKDALSLNLDAVSGGTYINVNGVRQDQEPENWINSFSDWNLIYVEAILSQKKVKILYNSLLKPLQMNAIVNNSMTIKDDKLIIGYAEGAGSNSSFKGLIDNVRVYDRTFTEEELQKLLNLSF